jgi:hypothetical protein
MGFVPKLKRYAMLSGNAGIAIYASLVCLLCVFLEVLSLVYGARHVTPVIAIILGSVVQWRLATSFAVHGSLPFVKSGLPLIAMQLYWVAVAALVLLQWALPIW